MRDDPNSARARELLLMATRLLALARELERDPAPGENPSRIELEPNDAVLVELARQIYSARRQRAILTDWQDLFGEPAWDMMLDLFVAAHERRNVSVTSAGLASGVPTTTALRWLRILEARKIVERDADPADERRSFVSITASAFAELNVYLRNIANGHSAFAMLTPRGRVNDRPSERETVEN